MTLGEELIELEKVALLLRDRELAAITELQACRNAYQECLRKLESLRYRVNALEAPPVDRSNAVLTSGEPVPEDRGHTELKSNGQQKEYVVLSDVERAKGFVRPVRFTYVHKTCGCHTRMPVAIAKAYARDPDFYDWTFCVDCARHFPLDQFVWEGTDEILGS